MQVDSQLVIRARRGESAALTELVRRWSPRVLAVCSAHVRCRHTAEDLAQEALLTACETLGSLRDDESFGAWLRGIARNVCLNWLKKRRNSQIPFSVLQPDDSLAAATADPADTGTETPDHRMEQSDQQQRFRQAVDALPETLRETLLLYYADRWTYDELGNVLGVAPSTVNARLSKARRLLRQALVAAEGKQA